MHVSAIKLALPCASGLDVSSGVDACSIAAIHLHGCGSYFLFIQPILVAAAKVGVMYCCAD